ncbi:hypothetical protein KR032_005854 [Drosophila birchii]|nr:hypothetical protein KR032_005854 [Drosophila birchii]
MSSVATWMARLDEKDKQVQEQRKAAVKVPKKLPSEPPVEQMSEDGVNNELSAVVDLCHDGDEKDSLPTFNTETVLLESSVIIIDDDLGEVNLKEFADHIEGKLDVQTLKKKNQDTTQDSTGKYSGPSKHDALRRSLKTYERKRKSTEETIGEALSVIMAKDPKILREINREASREAGQKPRKSDCHGPKVDKEVTADGNTTLVSSGNSQQKLQIVTEPTAYYNLETKPDVQDKLKKGELESKSDMERKTEPEIRTNAKENTPKNGVNLEQAYGERTKEGALPEDSLRNQRLDKDNHAPQIRIRTDLGPHQRDVIRVRTDLLLDQPPEESLNYLGNQRPSTETLVPERTANKRILPEAQCLQHPPKRPALESYSPHHMRPVTSTSSHQPNNPANRAPITNDRYPSSNPMPPPPAPSSNYSTVVVAPATAARSAPSPIIPMMNNFPPLKQYQPSMPMPAARISGAPAVPIPPLSYAPVSNVAPAPAAPVPPLGYAPVPAVAPAPAIVMQSRSGAAVLNPQIDLNRIMGMLNEMELFAYRQKNREAFGLITMLRKSLQKEAACAYRQ